MAESVWATIARLRQRDPHLLAPAVMRAWDRGRTTCTGLYVNVAAPDAPDDLVHLGDLFLMETLRVDALQQIYLAQGTSRTGDALRSHHGFGTAFDVVHREYQWFTNRASLQRWPTAAARTRASVRWFRAVAGILTRGQALAWGGLWRTFPDSPHFQSALLPVSPDVTMRQLYHDAGGGAAGRHAVWSHYHLL